MFIEFIERLRTRPPAARKRFALFSASIVTMSIALVWGVTLPARMGSLQVPFRAIPEIDASASAAGGVQDFINMQETFGGNVPESAPVAQPTLDGGVQKRAVIVATSSSATR